ncbi:hypothetical protein SacN8_06035 [Sulfolobus acidocaldarius N8]|uniref:Uncharacterized protein n=2 Tax=Sulfolobus acidocaldarius TaxID=2285 RepID=M1IY88_9CREN|nr:hypothetical protein SacN8_06035 [Sulfolobus acidocaldarius N8]AGE73442.1 hypothetical protein SacRon12I_06030 [Sulfolobus acidocaldarius Ron12/I]
MKMGGNVKNSRLKTTVSYLWQVYVKTLQEIEIIGKT